MDALLDQMLELYFLGGDLNEILSVAKEQGYGKRNYKKWTTLEIIKVKRMRSNGYTYREIAETLDRNANQVSQAYYRGGGV